MEKIDKLIDFHCLVRLFNNIDDKSGDSIYGIFLSFILKLTYLFFINIDEKISPIGKLSKSYAPRNAIFPVYIEQCIFN